MSKLELSRLIEQYNIEELNKKFNANIEASGMRAGKQSAFFISFESQTLPISNMAEFDSIVSETTWTSLDNFRDWFTKKYNESWNFYYPPASSVKQGVTYGYSGRVVTGTYNGDDDET